jgi:hypothetical protein
MNGDKLLIALTVAGSALCMWPAAIEPSIDFSRWILLVVVALTAGLSATLFNGYWVHAVIASVAGVFAGGMSAFVFFPSSDGIANSFAPLVILAATLAAILVSVPSCLVGRRLAPLSKHHRRAVWLAFLCPVSFGPVALALTPPMVTHRVARNDGAAVERFEGLRSAVEQTSAQSGDPERICDGQALRRQYSGPAFSDEDWQRITENYVKQEGYVFMVYCHEKGQGKNGYTIDAWPARGEADGTRHFCTDESTKIGRGMEWNRTRHVCTKSE